MEAERSPAAGRGPGGERLLAALLLLQVMDEYTPLEEAIVTMALNPMWVPDLEDYSQHDAYLAAMLRTSAYYVLDADQTHDALASIPPALPSFPPLPFRRIWIETQNRQEGGSVKPGMYASWETENGDGSREIVDVFGIAISEVVRGREWQIYLPFQRTKMLDDGDIPISKTMMTMAFHITPYEIKSPTPVGKTVKEWHQGHLVAMLQLAINGAMLITARGVPKREFQLPRHQRKRLRHMRWAPRTPKLYYVDLAEAGEDEERHSSRTYHVRWLVSGHWRHLDGADELCTCWKHRHNPQPATYIEPYVKGPPGAPWIGRPVHRAV